MQRIPNLGELTVGQRFLLIIIIALIILFAMAAFGYFGGSWDDANAQQSEQLYGDTSLDAVLIRLDKRALDTAYEQRLVRLWEVWISPTTRDPTAFTNGLRIARQRYAEAAAGISRRERQILELEQRHQEQRK